MSWFSSRREKLMLVDGKPVPLEFIRNFHQNKAPYGKKRRRKGKKRPL